LIEALVKQNTSLDQLIIKETFELKDSEEKIILDAEWIYSEINNNSSFD
jgi:hypothetical protein